MLPGPPTAATPGARVGVLGFDQAQADQSPVLIHSLNRVTVQLQLADHGRWGVKPSRAQRGKRHRLLTSTTQLLKCQTMLSLNERHRIGLSTPRPPIQALHAATGSPSAAPARAVATVIQRRLWIGGDGLSAGLAAAAGQPSRWFGRLDVGSVRAGASQAGGALSGCWPPDCSCDATGAAALHGAAGALVSADFRVSG